MKKYYFKSCTEKAMKNNNFLSYIHKKYYPIEISGRTMFKKKM